MRSIKKIIRCVLKVFHQLLFHFEVLESRQNQI